jgi:F-type H+-transporting ATPase subunit a
MTERIVAEAAIHVGHHAPVWHWFGLTINGDTVIATAIAAVIVIALAFVLRAKVTSTGVPGGVQLFWETLTIQMRNQVESAIGMKIAPFVLPLAIALFVFILVANWLSVLPVMYTDSSGATAELLKPPASDINFVLALALFVFIAYHVAGIWRRGIIGHPIKVAKGHVAFLAPINIVEEIAKPISLSLRLFGNIFAGGIMVALIALFPAWIMWAPNAIWKAFDLFVGLIQAFIFALLTILYFGQSMELDHDHDEATASH